VKAKLSAFSARRVVCAVLCGVLIGCGEAPPFRVVVVGGGPAGLSAALELASGVEVVLLEKGEALGGSARYAAGITAVPGASGTSGLPPGYAARVNREVIEWTASLGCPWVPAHNPLQDGLLLRKPVGGGAALMKILAGHAAHRGVQVRLGAEVNDLTRGKRWNVGLAGGASVVADAVIVATGGFAGTLARVRAAWGADGPLLRGAPSFADGKGGDLVVAVGGQRTEPPSVLFYGHGVPSPADPTVALMIAEAPGAVWLDGTGQAIAPKVARGEGGNLGSTGTGWVVLDQEGIASLRLADPMGEDPVDSAGLIARAGWGALSVADLARRTGLSVSVLGERTCPCAALPIRPTSAKSLTGVVTDAQGRVVDLQGAPIPGLYAAGEVAGFGGGRHPPVDSTMIAAAILSGRDAGRAARVAR